MSLTPSQCKQAAVSASSGNHGAAIAFDLYKSNKKGIIFVPENTSTTKVNNICHYTNDLKFYGSDCLKTEIYALEYAKQHNKIYISFYNDLQVISGQGNYCFGACFNQIDSIDAVFVPIGGGGFISGIAGYLKSVNPKIQIIGCLPENSSVMPESVKAGRIIEREILPTLSDATAGSIEPNFITFIRYEPRRTKRWGVSNLRQAKIFYKGAVT